MNPNPREMFFSLKDVERMSILQNGKYRIRAYLGPASSATGVVDITDLASGQTVSTQATLLPEEQIPPTLQPVRENTLTYRVTTIRVSPDNRPQIQGPVIITVDEKDYHPIRLFTALPQGEFPGNDSLVPLTLDTLPVETRAAIHTQRQITRLAETIARNHGSFYGFRKAVETQLGRQEWGDLDYVGHDKRALGFCQTRGGFAGLVDTTSAKKHQTSR